MTTATNGHHFFQVRIILENSHQTLSLIHISPDEKKENKDDSESEKPVYTVKPTASTDENAGDELPEGDMDEMTKEILNFFEEDK